MLLLPILRRPSCSSGSRLSSCGGLPITALAYYAVDTASNDTYLAQVDGIDSYDTGLFVLLNPVTDNTTACTLNINGMGAKSIKTPTGGDPGTGWIDANSISPMTYDGTNFVIMTMDNNP